MLKTLKKVVLGPPLASKDIAHQRLGKKVALAIFSSDNMSSVAYATEEILLVLVTAGATAIYFSVPIAIAISILIFILVVSYSETLYAYPSGGGAYIVAKDNLGVNAGLTAGAALLIDYVLTVSVSITAGVAAITSAFPNFYEHRVGLCLFLILIMTLANLRGVKESASIFALPTYFFLVSFLVLIGCGFYQYIFGGMSPTFLVAQEIPHAIQPITYFLILRAFSSGCAAVTGIEAISNGVTAFKPPESRNATITLIWMGIILFVFFMGITELAKFYHILPRPEETVVSQLARHIFQGGPFYYLIQAATAMILILAANTSYAGFPRLASFLARDGFLPRQLSSYGDRLAFSNGIIVLGLCSAFLIVLFNATTHSLIPLYAIGVFLSFTLSQGGMVRHWFKDKKGAWFVHAGINATGAIVTGVATAVIAATKFAHGAWIVIIVIPLIVMFFHAISRHYKSIVRQLHPEKTDLVSPGYHKVVIPISALHKGAARALGYAKLISPDVEAVYISLDPERTKKMQDVWKSYEIGVPLTVLESPYRSVVQPLVNYIDKVRSQKPDQLITVILPEFVPLRWWQQVLHNQTALLIRAALLFKKGVVVTSIRHFLTD